MCICLTADFSGVCVCACVCLWGGSEVCVCVCVHRLVHMHAGQGCVQRGLCKSNVADCITSLSLMVGSHRPKSSPLGCYPSTFLRFGTHVALRFSIALRFLQFLMTSHTLVGNMGLQEVINLMSQVRLVSAILCLIYCIMLL